MVVVLIVTQMICVILFGIDLVTEVVYWVGHPSQTGHLVLEAMAILCLLTAIIFEWSEGKRLMNKSIMLEENLSMAQKTVYEMIETHFDRWTLTPSERDIAGFVVKGLSTAQIADLRGCSEATVKAHLNAVFRKSGSRNRTDMLGQVIDSLIGVQFEQALLLENATPKDAVAE